MLWVLVEMGYCYAYRWRWRIEKGDGHEHSKDGQLSTAPTKSFDLVISRSGGKRNGLRVAAQML